MKYFMRIISLRSQIKVLRQEWAHNIYMFRDNIYIY